MSDYSHIIIKRPRVSYYSQRRSLKNNRFSLLYSTSKRDKSNEESHESNLKDLFFSMAFDKWFRHFAQFQMAFNSCYCVITSRLTESSFIRPDDTTCGLDTFTNLHISSRIYLSLPREILSRSLSFSLCADDANIISHVWN